MMAPAKQPLLHIPIFTRPLTELRNPTHVVHICHEMGCACMCLCAYWPCLESCHGHGVALCEVPIFVLSWVVSLVAVRECVGVFLFLCF